MERTAGMWDHARFVYIIAIFFLTGILAGIWPCGVIVFFAELFQSESCSQVYGTFHELLRRNDSSLSTLSESLMDHGRLLHEFYAEYLCYDDGCHLRRYATNPIRRDLTKWTKKISDLEIVIDKLHFAGHVDKWCRQVCDPYKHRDLDKVMGFCIMTTYVTVIAIYYTVCTLNISSIGWHRNLWAVLFVALQICTYDTEDEQKHIYVLSFVYSWVA